MNYEKTKVHSFGKIHGGKNRYARQYIESFDNLPCEKFPEACDTYVEPFAGGAGVLMNIPKGTFKREIISDIDPSIYRVLRTLRDRGNEVQDRLRLVPYGERSFLESLELVGNTDDITHTVHYIVHNRMSRGGRGQSYASSNRLRGNQMGDKNAWDNFVNDKIFGTIDRLQGVEIRNTDGLTLMRSLVKTNGAKKIFYYLDPPYLPETLVTKDNYNYTVGREYHVKLLEFLTSKVPGRFYLSGYMDADLYRDFLTTRPGWRRYEWKRAADSAHANANGKKTSRIEVVWTNVPERIEEKGDVQKDLPFMQVDRLRIKK